MSAPTNAAALPVLVPKEKAAELKSLTHPPALAMPTFLMWLVAVVGVVIADTLALTGHMSLWIACVLNIVVMYPLFGVIHDASHRSISSNGAVNDWLGQIGLGIIVPGASLAMFRWAHMQHHRFTNGVKDPDQKLHHGYWWTLPLRWMFFDIVYILFLASKEEALPKKYFRISVLAVLGNIVLMAWLVYAGYAMPMLLLWLIPSRVTMFNFGFTFFWLPHTLDGVTAEENLTLATNMRLGKEWLMNPVCQFHNYHLLHHLYPSAPPYNHPKIWKLMEPEIRKRDLAIQKDFAIYPDVHRGQATA
jgi:beta-carotene hydroxylase